MKKATLFMFAIINLISTQYAYSEEKDNYNIFNPTPKNKMRELSTDRPDKTESAYSVDAGHFQYEGDLVILNDNLSSTDR